MDIYLKISSKIKESVVVELIISNNGTKFEEQVPFHILCSTTFADAFLPGLGKTFHNRVGESRPAKSGNVWSGILFCIRSNRAANGGVRQCCHAILVARIRSHIQPINRKIHQLDSFLDSNPHSVEGQSPNGVGWPSVGGIPL